MNPSPSILYIANVRLPTPKAHGLQIMKACEAFAHEGAQIELLVPTRKNDLREEPFSYYKIKTRFPIKKIFVPDTVSLGKLGFAFQSLFFGMRAARIVSAHPGQVVYGRDEIVLAIVSFLTGKNVVWESHDGAWNRWANYLGKRAKGIVVVTRAAADFYAAKGVAREKLLSMPNGIDLSDFAGAQAQAEAKKRLGLSLQKTTALYIGALGGWKGVDTLLEASNLVPEDIEIAIVGGEEAQIKPLRERYPRAHFLGARPYSELRDTQAAADLLVLPNTAKDPTSVAFTSPLKLFSYMAARKPIIASDLPSIREIVDERCAAFFTPDDPSSLARAIKNAAENLGTYTGIAEEAAKRVMGYTWDARARRVISFLQKLA